MLYMRFTPGAKWWEQARKGKRNMKLEQKTLWYATDVHRPNAGRLFNAVRWINNRMVESEQTPTHSRALAQQHANELNKRAGKRG